MGSERLEERERAPNKLGLAPKILAGWLALHSPADIARAEIPNGTPWPNGLTMMHADATTKPYEVGGLVRVPSNKKYEWRQWRRGEEPKNEKETPGVQTPFQTIAETLKTLRGKDEYLCVMHSHIKPKIMGLNVTSMPPSPGDMFSAVMAAVSPHIPERDVGKIKHGLVDNLGVWSYRLVEPAQLLRQRIKTDNDLKEYLQINRQKYNVAMEAGLQWTTNVGQMEMASSFGSLSDSEKVGRLRSSKMYQSFQQQYLDAGLAVKYATREEAAVAAPCDERIGK